MDYYKKSRKEYAMKDKWINIRCTEQERQDITEQAKANNMSVAEYIRYLVAKERKEREK
jgi:predicted DNA binding CopG/RHH family protein